MDRLIAALLALLAATEAVIGISIVDAADPLSIVVGTVMFCGGAILCICALVWVFDP